MGIGAFTQSRTVLASAARTASVDSADFLNQFQEIARPHLQRDFDGIARGLHLIIDVTAINLTPSITVKIQGKDPLSGKYYDLITSAAITAVGTTVLKVYPGITAAANLAVSDVLPPTWRVSIAHANANSITYSVGAVLLP